MSIFSLILIKFHVFYGTNQGFYFIYYYNSNIYILFILLIFSIPSTCELEFFSIFLSLPNSVFKSRVILNHLMSLNAYVQLCITQVFIINLLKFPELCISMFFQVLEFLEVLKMILYNWPLLHKALILPGKINGRQSIRFGYWEAFQSKLYSDLFASGKQLTLFGAKD